MGGGPAAPHAAKSMRRGSPKRRPERPPPTHLRPSRSRWLGMVVGATPSGARPRPRPTTHQHDHLTYRSGIGDLDRQALS